jgi:hypothetical protein
MKMSFVMGKIPLNFLIFSTLTFFLAFAYPCAVDGFSPSLNRPNAIKPVSFGHVFGKVSASHGMKQLSMVGQISTRAATKI